MHVLCTKFSLFLKIEMSWKITGNDHINNVIVYSA